jgi:hypothetical protein
MIRVSIPVVTLVAALAATAGCGGERVVIDLVETFPSARQQPGPDVFQITQATIKDDTRPAILVKAPSRITWRVEVPQKGWLKVGAALREDAWTVPGDGVMFEVRITYNKSGQVSNDQLTSFIVNPYGNAADRTWHDVTVDLSQHGGTTVELIFNTRSSWSPQGAQKDDQNGDLALWGAPRITAR